MLILQRVWNLELQSTDKNSLSMVNQPKQFIAIDINIFFHLVELSKLDEEVNHIEELLDMLQELGVHLIVDCQWKIWGNYMSKVAKIMGDDKEFNFTEMFRYWFGSGAYFKTVQVNKDQLFTDIVETLNNQDYEVEEEHEIDTLLVYISVCEDTVLISNDRSDFIGEFGEIREELVRISKTYGYRMFMIFDSSEAHEWLFHP